ncbi:MAG: hypothetical protein OQJ80_05530 [Kangiella sp.]|nr:hypothetical protein [Kangiella sp.]
MEALQPFLITPGLVIVAIILNKITSSSLIHQIYSKYPKVYRHYFIESKNKSDVRKVNFTLEFVMAGLYKEELNPEDFKYVKRVKFTLWIMAICICVSLYDVYG